MELYVHTQKKEQSPSEHIIMYHVLEGPTPVESSPETQEQEVCTQYMFHAAPVHKLSNVQFVNLNTTFLFTCPPEFSGQITDIFSTLLCGGQD